MIGFFWYWDWYFTRISIYIYTVNEHCEWASYLLMRMNHQVSIRVHPYVHNSWHAKRNRSATASWAQNHLGMLYTTYIFMVIWGMVYYCFTHIIRYAGIFDTTCTLQGWTKNKNTVSNHQLATETQFRKKMKDFLVEPFKHATQHVPFTLTGSTSTKCPKPLNMLHIR